MKRHVPPSIKSDVVPPVKHGSVQLPSDAYVNLQCSPAAQEVIYVFYFYNNLLGKTINIPFRLCLFDDNKR